MFVDLPQILNTLSAIPFGKLPVLDYKGTWIVQSSAILRFLSKTHGLAGKSLLEEAKVDMYICCADDLYNGKQHH